MLKVKIDAELGAKLGLEQGEYETHQITKGVVVLSKSFEKKEPAPPIPEELFSPQELSVLRKITAFRFENRIPSTVNKSLSEPEKKVLDSLIQEGIVRVYREGKYAKTGVYSISRKFFPLLYGPVQNGNEKQATPGPGAQAGSQKPNPAGALPEPQKPGASQAKPQVKLSGIERLQKSGFAIIDSEFEAREISSALEKRIRAGDYLGVRAFNNKYYVSEKGFYISLSEKIRRILVKKDAQVSQIAAELKASEDACTVALTLMNNESEVIEKKKGFYGLL